MNFSRRTIDKYQRYRASDYRDICWDLSGV